MPSPPRAVCLALVCLGLPATAPAWESQLLPFDEGEGTHEERTVTFDGRDWRLPDYSYVGFALGEAPLGDGVPCNQATLDAENDITEELQSAIDNVGSGGGGVVRIPAGNYTLSASIEVPYNNVSIEGAGSGETTLEVTAAYDPDHDRDEGVFTFGKAVGGWHKAWKDRGDTVGEVAAPIAAGDRNITMADASNVNTGDWVVVTQYFWPEFSEAHSAGQWPSVDGWPADAQDADARFSFTYLRQVVATDGDTVALDAPIPRALDPADNPVKLRSATSPAWIAPRHHLGIAGVSITFADNTSGADNRPVGSAVYFEGVRDGWAYDVHTRNIPRFGFMIDDSARISVVDSAVYDAQDYGGGGYGYAYHVFSSQNILVRDSYSEEVRHGFIPQRALSSMLVFSGNASAAARLNDDVHHSYVHNVLWDDHSLTHGSGLHATYRGTHSDGAHETNGRVDLWNVAGDGWRGGGHGGSLHLNPASGERGIVVGGPGEHVVFDAGRELGDGDRMPADDGLQVAPTDNGPGRGRQDRNVLYEGLYRSNLEPASLYGTQLANRTNSADTAFAGGCGKQLTEGPRQPSTYTGDGLLVFDSDHLGYTPRLHAGCTDCDIDTSARNHTGDGQESFKLTLSDTQWAMGAKLRGPTLDTGDYENVTLWVYPEASDYEAYIRLAYDPWPEGSPTSLGDVVVDGLTDNRWNKVTIPLSEFDTGRFNSMQIRSRGTQSASTTHLDDVVLAPADPPAACEDSVDNDGDGQTDYPEDAGCDSAADDDESDECQTLGDALRDPLCILRN